MDANLKITRTDMVPTTGLRKSYLKTNPSHLTTLNASFLVPIFTKKVIPNATYKLSIGTILRMFALKNPVFGDLYLDCYAYYVPYHLLYEKWEKLITEGHDNTYDEQYYGPGSHTPNPQSVGAPITPDLYVPTLRTTDKTDGFEVKSMSLLNYTGVRIANTPAHNRSIKKMAEVIGVEYNELSKKSDKEIRRLYASYKEKNKSKKDFEPVNITPALILNDSNLSAFPVRAYTLIHNSDFRAPFLQGPHKIDYSFSESDPNDYELLRVCRSKDFFSTGYVASQLNSDISIAVADAIELIGDNSNLLSGLSGYIDTPIDFGTMATKDSGPIYVRTADNNSFYNLLDDIGPGSDMLQTGRTDTAHKANINAISFGNGDNSANGRMYNVTANVGMKGNDLTGADIVSHIAANVRGASAITINNLRNAIALQHISERALLGTSMEQVLKACWDLDLPKYKVDKPLLFGAKRVPISISQVVQTSKTDGESALGDVAGLSCTVANISDQNFIFSSYDYGLIMVCVCVRHKSVYQYGINPIYFERDKFSYYWRDFEGLSNVPIPEKAIYYSGDTLIDERVFNFNEYGCELFNDNDIISGDFSSDADEPLDDYHLGDIYDEAPYYDDDWILDTTKEVLDRCIALNSDTAPQFYGIFSMNFERMLPVKRGLPGLTRI